MWQVFKLKCSLLMATPRRLLEMDNRAAEVKKRLEKCWSLDLDWNLYPNKLRKGCEELGLSYDMPPSAVLSGLLLLVSYCQSHGRIVVPGTEWSESLLLWITICMPTGSGKTPLYGFLSNVMEKVRSLCGLTDMDPLWMLDEASFEKMGAMMSANNDKLLGLYDEMSTYLAQINIYRGKGLSESHELSAFLSLYNGKSWTRATVSGDANFHMKKTALTVGGFTQPTVAKSLIELPVAVEKGLVPRFLWIFPKPSYAPFSSLKPANTDFCDYIVEKLVDLQKSATTTFSLPTDSEAFQVKFDLLQEQIQHFSILDELLAGTLSKAKGQILRVSACLHVLFDDQGTVPSSTIKEDAIKAAENYVDVCCQHVAYISGKGLIEDEVKRICDGTTTNLVGLRYNSTAGYCLTLPGHQLDLSVLLQNKKFRTRGNKDGALKAMRELESVGLGQLIKKDAHRGTSALYIFNKPAIPDNQDELTEFCAKIAKYGLSLAQYKSSLTTDRICTPTKRVRDDDD